MNCKMWMIQGSPRTPDRLPELSGSHVQQSEVFRTMTGARGPYNLGGSAIALSCAPFLGHRNGSKASLGLLGWVCFGHDLCYHFGCWWGFAEVFDLVVAFGVVEVCPLWHSR